MGSLNVRSLTVAALAEIDSRTLGNRPYESFSICYTPIFGTFPPPIESTSMPTDLTTRILQAVAAANYTPCKPKALARRLAIPDEQYPEFRRTLRQLLRDGRLAQGRASSVKGADVFGTIVGTYRRLKSGKGLVRPHETTPDTGLEIKIRDGDELDASSGDEVMVQLKRRAGKSADATGRVVQILKRATRTFVGSYFEREGQGYVAIDGNVFAHSIWVGDTGAKGAKPQEKVVIEMLRFPTADERGEGVIIEVLGPLGEPGVDLMSIIKAFGLPEEFPPAVLDEARQQADRFREDDLDGRTDFTNETIITIDPLEARDFDDAVSVTIDPKSKHWILTVHIADVAHFAKPGSALDNEARKRATSIYLPQKVIPMFPEVVSNGLASLQQGKLRYVKTVRMEFTPGLKKGHVSFFNGAIRVTKRFTYEEVSAILLDDPTSRKRKRRTNDTEISATDTTQTGADAFGSSKKSGADAFGSSKKSGADAFGSSEKSGADAYGSSKKSGADAFGASKKSGADAFGSSEKSGADAYGSSKKSGADAFGASKKSGADAFGSSNQVLKMLARMRDLAMLLRKKRMKRGSLELTMPEAVLEYDDRGQVSGAHFAVNDISHQIIEEFMLAANEAVAEHFARNNVPFLRRVHPAPKEEKLETFADFARLVGYPIDQPTNRFELQKLLVETADKPERAAIHFGLLRSLKQATYTPIADEHYALASNDYCHFTSPIRRYPDLQVHRLLDRWVRAGKASADQKELVLLGQHCSQMERRAEQAERELVKLKLLQHLQKRIGEEFDAVITGVADYGFFAQAEQIPAEGMVHISSLTDDYYNFDEAEHALFGAKSKRRLRLGDRVRVVVARVDISRRMLDFRLAKEQPTNEPRSKPKRKSSSKTAKAKKTKSDKPKKAKRKRNE